MDSKKKKKEYTIDMISRATQIRHLHGLQHAISFLSDYGLLVSVTMQSRHSRVLLFLEHPVQHRDPGAAGLGSFP